MPLAALWTIASGAATVERRPAAESYTTLRHTIDGAAGIRQLRGLPALYPYEMMYKK
jgi:hypothetical protein